jgi:hypothetical protein
MADWLFSHVKWTQAPVDVAPVNLSPEMANSFEMGEPA